jgi:fatty-acyl-CoA synthase
VSDGTAGELVVRGANVMSGYWNDPAASAEARFGEWFRTGDTAVRGDDGYVTIVGRIKDMIITGGNNVYAAEVERALEDHPDIREIAIVGLPHPVWGETVVAIIVGERTVDVDAVQAWSRERLAAYKQPRVVIHVETLPRNLLGKVDKPALRANLSATST